MPERGKLIVFEGPDGNGKTTQCRLLSEYLTARHIPHILTREPTADNPVGLLLRQALSRAFSLTEDTLALLFAADRAQHVAEVIQPALQHGAHVLCDRYFYSNMAYQDLETAYVYNKKVISGCPPDITFFMDVPPEVCMERLTQRGGGELYENLQALTRVREKYACAFARVPGNIVTLDGTAGEEDLAARIREAVRVLFES